MPVHPRPALRAQAPTWRTPRDPTETLGAGPGTGETRRARATRSLGLVMGVIFLLSWLAQSVAGRTAYDERQLRDLEAPVSWPQYVGSADFWNRTLQNWQSEFLPVGSMVVLSIYLRQRGSPESEPAGVAHVDTGVEG